MFIDCRGNTGDETTGMLSVDDQRPINFDNEPWRVWMLREC
jgi:hypothetical protein